MFYLLIATAVGSSGFLAVPSAQVTSATDSSSACWNMDGIIDQKTGACLLPECPPGTVRESNILTGTTCKPLSEPQENTKQLGTTLPPPPPPAAVGQNLNNTQN